ncbi:hypothetical protein ACNPF7_05735 [Salmonella enterica subsp. enterica serovar Panama]|uniref:hypothetical protein n=1 Tax=Salmonella enterica TaxID=28901 RepID=UPI003AABF468
MKPKAKAKSPGYSTGMSQETLSYIVERTADIARECSIVEDKRLKEFVAQNERVAYKV